MNTKTRVRQIFDSITPWETLGEALFCACVQTESDAFSGMPARERILPQAWRASGIRNRA